MNSFFNYSLGSTKRVRAVESTIVEREQAIRDRECAVHKIEAERDELRRRLDLLKQQSMAFEAERNELRRRVDLVEQHGIIGETGNVPLEKCIARAISELEGWCTIRKARMLCDLIQSNDCRSALEVGIFGGRSLIPMALTMRHLGRGYVVGIDPWSNQEATKIATSTENDKWWRDIDLSKIKRSYLVGLLRFDVLPFVKTLELNSEQALAALAGQKFDLIHVDGSHAEEQAYRDVISWSKLLERGNILVMDDINWETVRKARSWIINHFDVIDEVSEEDSAYGAYRKR
jgi:predicted O-methyltransferase YrrM